ncbi:MAG: hypothetical protein RIK87_05265 [Fuerstiella sp.]
MCFHRYVIVVFFVGLVHSDVALGGLILNVTQNGNDVHVVASGELNTASLTHVGDFFTDSRVKPNIAQLYIGPTGAIPSGRYEIPIGPTSFGSGLNSLFTTFADSGAGDRIGIVGALSNLWLPVGYVSGDSLFGSSVFSNETLASLGLNDGTHVWSWGTGADTDSLTVNIGTSPVPEPSSPLIWMAGCATIALALRRRSSRDEQ